MDTDEHARQRKIPHVASGCSQRFTARYGIECNSAQCEYDSPPNNLRGAELNLIAEDAGGAPNQHDKVEK